MALVTTNTTLGGLSCRILEDDTVKPALLAVFCHGFGAPGDDLVGIARQVVAGRSDLAGVRFVFPVGPLGLEGWGRPGGRAWWLFDFARLALLGEEGARDALRREVPEGLAKSRRLLRGALDVLWRGAGPGPDRTVIGGFSQGAMLVTDVTLHLEEAPAALVLLSGSLIAETEWTRLAVARRGLRVLQSHGRSDPLLPFAAAEALRDLLTGAGLDVDFRAFAGGHTVPPDVAKAVASVLTRELAAAQRAATSSKG